MCQEACHAQCNRAHVHQREKVARSPLSLSCKGQPTRFEEDAELEAQRARLKRRVCQAQS